MSKRLVIITFALCGLSNAACASKTPQEPPTFTAPKPEPGIVYVAGFSGKEGVPGGNSWRWMGPEGVVKLENTGRDMVLVLAGSAPTHVFKSAATITLTLNGAPLGQFAGQQEVSEHRYEISAAQLGAQPYAELRINSDKFLVPQEVDKNLQDTRRLAFSLTKLTWKEK